MAVRGDDYQVNARPPGSTVSGSCHMDLGREDSSRAGQVKVHISNASGVWYMSGNAVL